MSHVEYHSPYHDRGAMAERRDRALRNRHELEDTSGRLPGKRIATAVPITPQKERLPVVTSQRFEPTYLSNGLSLESSDNAGFSSQSGSLEEAEAESDSCSLTVPTATEENKGSLLPFVKMSGHHPRTVGSEDYLVTDGEDSLLESDDDDGSFGIRRKPLKAVMSRKQRPTQKFENNTLSQKPNRLKHEAETTNFQPRQPKTFLQPRAPLRSHGSGDNNNLPGMTPIRTNSSGSFHNLPSMTPIRTKATIPQDDISNNDSSLGSNNGQTRAPILRKSESYRTFDTSASGGASETDDDDSMMKSRRKVKFHETSRGELRNTIHEYEDDSLTAQTERTEDTLSTYNDGPLPTFINEHMEDALLDFFFLGQSARPRPLKKKKPPPKTKTVVTQKKYSRRGFEDDESVEEDFRTLKSSKPIKTKNNSTRSNLTSADDNSFEDDGDSVEFQKKKNLNQIKKNSSTKKLLSSTEGRSRDDLSVEDDVTNESQTTMSAYTADTGLSWSKGSIQEEEEDETTAASSAWSNKYSTKKRRSPSEKKDKEDTGDDPFEMVDNFCQMVGNACGIIALSIPPIYVNVPKKENTPLDEQSVTTTKSNDSAIMASSGNCINKCKPYFEIDADALASAQSKVIILAHQCQDWAGQSASRRDVSKTSSGDSLDLPANDDEELSQVIEEKDEKIPGERKMEKIEEEENDEKELENGLLELVKCAARSKHLQQGLVFDESYEIDVTSEVKFVAINTSLPLGVVFKENSGGCFVTRVFKSKSNADGSFAKIPIEAGDQLTSINKKSAMKKTVSQVCAMMNSSPDPKNISLTLLRYTGDMHSITQSPVHEKQGVAAAQVEDPNGSFAKQSISSRSIEQISDLSVQEAATNEIMFVKPDSIPSEETKNDSLEASNLPQEESKMPSMKQNDKLEDKREPVFASRRPLAVLNPNRVENHATGAEGAVQQKKKKGLLSRFRLKKKMA